MSPGTGRVSSAFAFEPIMPLFCQSEATETRLPEKPFRLAGKNLPTFPSYAGISELFCHVELEPK